MGGGRYQGIGVRIEINTEGGVGANRRQGTGDVSE